MFPNITYGKKYKIVEKINILEKKKRLENIPLLEKYFDFDEILEEIMSVRYFKRYMDIFPIIYDKDFTDLDTDTDTDTDIDIDTEIDKIKDNIRNTLEYEDMKIVTQEDVDKFTDKIIREELYMKDLFDEDENICEQVYIEACNDIYDEI